LGEFGKYLLCQGQDKVDVLGYSALPINLVQAGFDQLKKVPGADINSINIASCQNPTFSTNGTNTLAVQDPSPPACDKQGSTQCSTGTGGAKASTPVKAGAQGGASGATQSGGSNATVANNVAGGGASAGTGPNATSGAGKVTGNQAPGATGGPAGRAPAPAVACDPDSGSCDPAAPQAQTDGSDSQAASQPVSVSASLGDGLQVTLMALAAALLLGLGLAPPLIGHASNRRRSRRNPPSPSDWDSR
jgi:hypothetical protein